MATEAQLIILLGKRSVEYRRVFFGQKPEVLAAVHRVAAAAILLGDRPVEELFVLNLGREGGQNFVLAYLLGLVVACYAQAHGVLFQEEFHRRGMRRMALEAAIDIGHNRVLVRRILGDLLYIFVTRVAKERRNGFDHLWVAGAVRIVAPDAVVLRRLVDKFKLLQFVLGYDMAGKAKLRVLTDEQTLVVGAVRFVTNRTLTDGCRTMQEVKAARNLVAFLTKGLNRNNRRF